MSIKYLPSQAQSQPPASSCQADPTAVGPAPSFHLLAGTASQATAPPKFRLRDPWWGIRCSLCTEKCLSLGRGGPAGEFQMEAESICALGKPGLENCPNPWRWNGSYLRGHVASGTWMNYAGIRIARFSQTSQQFHTFVVRWSHQQKSTFCPESVLHLNLPCV